MIEFLFNKELLLIVIGCLAIGVGMYISDCRSKKREKRQARLNSIRIKDNQFEINADGSETDVERFGK